jgi:hypothetical protein
MCYAGIRLETSHRYLVRRLIANIPMKDYIENSLRSFPSHQIIKSILLSCTSISTVPHCLSIATTVIRRHDGGSITAIHASSVRKLHEVNGKTADLGCTHLTINSLNYMVRIEVGASFDKNTSKFFTVPSGLLTRRSISFKERLSKVPNVEVNVLSLPNYDPNTFELYLRLVYNNQVPNIPGPLPYDIIRKEQVRFAKLYVLCWKLQDVHGKNCALQVLRESIYRMWGTDNWTSPGFSVVETIYSGTVPGAQTRQLLLDVFCYDVDGARFVDDISKYPVEFLRDLGILYTMRFPPGSKRQGQNPARMLGALPYLEEEGVAVSNLDSEDDNGVDVVSEA